MGTVEFLLADGQFRSDLDLKRKFKIFNNVKLIDLTGLVLNTKTQRKQEFKMVRKFVATLFYCMYATQHNSGRLTSYA